MTEFRPTPPNLAPSFTATGLEPPLRVLVVEDDPLNARIFLKFLEKLGDFEALQTEDVQNVLDLVGAGRVDIVLMDVSLANSHYQGKKLDGIQLTQMVKALTPTLPVILVTAHAMKGDMERFLTDSGADGYISKPITDPLGFISQISRLGMRQRHEQPL